MTDRQLMELAAKAAGIEYGTDRTDCGLSLTSLDGRHRSLPKWNPLTDDGDALRLAVTLGLDIMRTDQDVEAIAGLPPFAPMDRDAAAPFGIEPLGDDPYAATRRAIVRAAAAIGEKMK